MLQPLQLAMQHTHENIWLSCYYTIEISIQCTQSTRPNKTKYASRLGNLVNNKLIILYPESYPIISAIIG